MLNWCKAIVPIMLLAACSHAPAQPNETTISTRTADAVTIYGERYFGNLEATAPLVLLFHQGGSNGRGEYSSIANWLNAEGYRAIAWDQRSGAARFDHSNRTVDGLSDGVQTGYCEVYPDLQAALDYVIAEELADQVVVWGSSYSAALVFELAAKNPESVAGVLAFSPAAGGPLEKCRARLWLGEITAPTFVLRPASEMERPSSQEQRDIFIATGAGFVTIEHGVHGSSMLVDDRTGQPMSDARDLVSHWLTKTFSSPPP